MSANKDVFADLFSTKKQDLSKLSLMERQKLSATTNNSNNSWNGLDLLNNNFSNGSITNNNNNNTNKDDDIFGLGLPSSNPVSTSNSFPLSTTNSNNNSNINLNNSHTSSNNSKIQDIDDLFAVFDTPAVTPTPSIPKKPTRSDSIDLVASRPKRSNDSARLKFGDSDKIPSRPRFERMNFRDSDTIPSRPRFNDSKSQSKYDDIPSRPRPNKDVHKLLDDISQPEDLANELFTLGSTFLNKGKQILNKNIEKFQAQKKAELNGKPAWMYQHYQETNDEEDDEAIDFDGTVVKNGKFNKVHEPFSEKPERPERPTKAAPERPERPRPVSKPIKREVKPPVNEPVLDIFSDLNINAVSNQTTNVNKNINPKFNQYRTLGNNFFKEGNYDKALINYQDCLKISPNEFYSILIYSNLSITFEKLGDSKNCLNCINEGLRLIQSQSTMETVVEDSKTVKDFYVKLIIKKAEIMEKMDKFSEALSYYKIALENGGTFKSVIDGKRRCLETLTPKPKPKPRKAVTKTFKNDAKINAKINQDRIKQEKLEQEKYQLYDIVEAKVNAWKHGKEDNIRALLISLDSILWKELNWKNVQLTDLVLNKKVKINYMKAVSKTHPDKINKSTTSVEQQLIAQNVFVTLNKAWDIFKEQNGMN